MRTQDQATPRLSAPAVPPPPGEEEPWLFSFHRPLSTQDVWRMGFSRVIVFGAHHWADEAVAAAEISEAFRMREALPSLAEEHKPALEVWNSLSCGTHSPGAIM